MISAPCFFFLVICRDEEGQILILKHGWEVNFSINGKPCKNSTLRMTTAVHLRIRELGVFFVFFLSNVSSNNICRIHY